MFQAVCRVCKKPVLRQNYKDHLKDVHKGEDPLDRRQWGDADNRGLFRGLTSSGDKNHNVRRKVKCYDLPLLTYYAKMS